MVPLNHVSFENFSCIFQIRLEAFGVISENHRTGFPLSTWELEVIEQFITSSLKIDSTAFRQSYCAVFRRLLCRFRDSGNTATKQKQMKLLHTYTSFLDKVIGLTLECISFDGSAFARRSTSLQLLFTFSKVFAVDLPEDVKCRWFSFAKICFSQRNGAVLLIRMLLTDTYEENKKIAFQLLKDHWTECGFNDGHKLVKIAHQKVASTNPHDATTAAYLFKLHCIDESLNKGEKSVVAFLRDQLLASLENQLKVARENLIKAATSQPLYPTILCIRYCLQEMSSSLVNKCLEDMRNYTLQLIRILLCVADVVSPVISHQSPEGNRNVCSVGEVEDNDNAMELLPEFLTVCCWRSIKEISLCLSFLVEMSVELYDSKIVLLNCEEIEGVGNYFKDMLLKARHRGAFEVAYAGFDQVCSKLWTSRCNDLNQLPHEWLKPLMQCFEKTGENISLSSTRRSAGLPYYFQAVVGSEPRLTSSASVSLLENVLNLLVERSLESKELMVQIHALNILRSLVRDARLDQAVSPFLGDIFITGMVALSSEQWSLRNSGTLLYSALINRVFGVHQERFSPAKKNTMTGRLFFSMYPKLFQFLLNFFSKKNKANHQQEISSAAVTFLSLFEHLYPSPFDTHETFESESHQVNVYAFIPALVSLLGHRSVRIRLMAARSIRNFVTVDSLPHLLSSLLNCLNELSCDSNYVDGFFTLCKKLVTMFSKDTESFDLICAVVFQVVSKLRLKIVHNVFLHASVLRLLQKLPATKSPEHVGNLIEFCLQLEEPSNTDISSLAYPFVQCELHFNGAENVNFLISKFLTHSNRYIRLAALDYLNETFLKILVSSSSKSFDNAIFKMPITQDDEYIPLQSHLENYSITRFNFSNLLLLAFDNLNKLSDSDDCEVGKIMQMLSFVCILSDKLSLGNYLDLYSRCQQLKTKYPRSSQVYLAIHLLMASVAPYMSIDNQTLILMNLIELIEEPDEDPAKLNVVAFGISNLAAKVVLSNDHSCDLLITLLTSNEPEIREYVSRIIAGYTKSSEYELFASPLSSSAFVIFLTLAVKSRPTLESACWLLKLASTSRQTKTNPNVTGKTVFEPEEINPFSEDRLLQNLTILLLSMIINGFDKTINEIFPRLIIPRSVFVCLASNFTSQEKNIVPNVCKIFCEYFQLSVNGVYDIENIFVQTEQKLKLGVTKEKDTSFDDDVHLLILACKLLDSMQFNNKIKPLLEASSNLDSSYVWGDSEKLEMLFIC